MARAIWHVTARVARGAFAPSVGRWHERWSDAAATSARGASALIIQRRRYETGLHLIVSGELDHVTSHQLGWQCERIDPRGTDTVLIDLADLTTIDSSGLDVISAAHAHLGERLVIISGPACTGAIDLASLRDQLPIIEG